MGLAQMGAKPAPYSGPPATFAPGGPRAGQPVPATRPDGSANPYANPNSRASQSMAKALAKKAAQLRKIRKGVRTAPNDPGGTGGPNDPAWSSLANLYKNGLPG